MHIHKMVTLANHKILVPLCVDSSPVPLQQHISAEYGHQSRSGMSVGMAGRTRAERFPWLEGVWLCG